MKTHKMVKTGLIVGMYIGNGQVVHAANEQDGVQIMPINGMEVCGAKRYW